MALGRSRVDGTDQLTVPTTTGPAPKARGYTSFTWLDGRA
jgi:hypothetical protein